MSKRIFKIVLTGGPCAGKTTILSILEQTFKDLNFSVFIIPESATELIANGVKPYGNILSPFDFQKILLLKQLEKEKLYDQIAKLAIHDDVLIIADRGLMDGKIYVTEEEFSKLLDSVNLTETDLKERYDLIIHLVTAANGAEEFYSTVNNSARLETPEEARILDNKGIAAWTGASNLKIVNNSGNFESKINTVLNAINNLVGLPAKYDKEYKFLIKMPDITNLLSTFTCSKKNIIQYYLISENTNLERKIRQITNDDTIYYYYCEKERTSKNEVISREKRLTNKEFLSYLTLIDKNTSPLHKTRYSFIYNDEYFSLDIFIFGTTEAILEVKSKEFPNELPDIFEILKNITNDPHYSNLNIAKNRTNFLTIIN